LIGFTRARSLDAAFFGEVSGSCAPQTTDCADALQYLPALHAAAFKMIDADAAPWTNAWTQGGCYTQIQNQMGSWIQYDSVSHQGTATHGETITATVALRNLGWSRVFTPRKLNLVLVSGAEVVTCKARLDLRALPPQATASSVVTIPSCAIPKAGTYQVYLSIPDAWPNTAGNPGFATRPGNADNLAAGQAWDGPNGRLSTGTTLVVN